MLADTRFSRLSLAKLESMSNSPKEGEFWQADHIVPVCMGGGESDLSNFRTLCVPCHEKVTRDLVTSGKHSVRYNEKFCVSSCLS